MAARAYWRYALLALAIAALVMAARFFPLPVWLETLNEWMTGLGVLGMVAFALVYAAWTVLLLPGSILTLAGGASFGLLRGFITVWLGATLGAALAFLVARHFARKRVEDFVERKPSFSAIDKAVAREGFKIVLLTRLSPVFPFNFQNYAYGLTSIGFFPYLFASWVGMIPGTFLYVYLGTLGKSGLEAASGAESVATLKLAVQGAGLLATLAVTVLVTRIARRALAQAGL
jgi:uncharacterized membrane protein YdjX (TVP38/TMEM64 family)